MKKTFLITGFEPFMGGLDNNSWEIAKKVTEKWNADNPNSILVVCEQLPVNWKTAKKSLKKAVEKNKPSYLLNLGLFDGINCLQFESVARNEAIVALDNDNNYFVKNQQGKVAIEKGKYLEIESLLPKDWLFDKFSKNINQSNNAGGYLCNYVFFQTMSNFSRIKKKGFIHVCSSSKKEGTDNAIKIILELIKYLS